MQDRRSGAGTLTFDVDTTDRWKPATLGALLAAPAAVVLAVFGIPPSPFMAPLYAIGVVLPGCGLTRAMVALVSGDMATAWAFNPASFALASAIVAGVVRSVVGFTTGRWLHARLRLSPPVVAAIVVSGALLWIRQQGNADLLIP